MGRIKKIKIDQVDPKIIPHPVLRSLVETYYDYQSQRISTASRIRNNCERNQISDELIEKYGVKDLLIKAESFEEDIKKLLKVEIEKHPLHRKYLSRIRGIGPILASGLISYIADISRFEHVSNLWVYFGWGMNRWCNNCEEFTYVNVEFKNREGKKTTAKRFKPQNKCPRCHNETIPVLQKRHAGYMNNWNDKAKVLAWKCGQSFVKSGPKSGYYRLYKQFKDEEMRLHPTKQVVKGKTMYNQGHLHNRAIRKVVKIFLSHLWETWRSMDGLEVTEPYAGKILGHDMIKPFTDRSSKEYEQASKTEDEIIDESDLEEI